MNALKRSLSGTAMSIVELVTGILLLINPVGFTSGIIIACGTILALCGIAGIVRYFVTEPEEAAERQMMAKGFVLLLVGGFCALRSEWLVASFPVLTVLYGVGLLLAGLVKIQWTVDMLRLKRRRWLFTLLSAAISLVCGVVIIASPFATAAVLWALLGISLIAEAVLDILAAVFGNKNAAAE